MKFAAYLSTFFTVACFLTYLYWANKMASSSKDGGHLFRREVGFNPFYCFYRPDLLSPDGQKFRVRAGYSFVAFVGLVALSIFLWTRV